MDPKIDVETLINDKKLLLEQVRELNEERAELTKKLGEAWDQVYALTSEVNRLTELVTAAQVK